MRLQRLIFLFFIAAALCARAQSVVATSERVVATLPASEAVFLVTVSGPLDRTLAGVVQALAPARILPQELVRREAFRYSFTRATAVQRFLFRAVRPMGRSAETQSALEKIASAAGDLSITASSYSQSSDAEIETARANLLPELFREAKARAAAMLIESGYRPGPIVELSESIVDAGSGWSFSLAVRMARLGAVQAAPVVSTLVTSAAQPVRFGTPQLTASYYALAEGRAQLFELLKPAGLTETQVTGLDSIPGNFNNPNGVTFIYRFTILLTEAKVETRPAKLPPLGNSSFDIMFPATPPPGDPVELNAIGRSKARPLAELLDGMVGESLGSTTETEGATTIWINASRSGDFSSNVIPSERVYPLPTALSEPVPPPSRRYRFEVIGAIPE